MNNKSFFSKFSHEQILNQYRANYQGLLKLKARAEKTNKPVNGYTLEQINDLVKRYKLLSKSK